MTWSWMVGCSFGRLGIERGWSLGGKGCGAVVGEGRVVEWSLKWAGLYIRGRERFC